MGAPPRARASRGPTERPTRVPGYQAGAPRASSYRSHAACNPDHAQSVSRYPAGAHGATQANIGRRSRTSAEYKGDASQPHQEQAHCTQRRPSQKIVTLPTLRTSYAESVPRGTMRGCPVMDSNVTQVTGQERSGGYAGDFGDLWKSGDAAYNFRHHAGRRVS